MWRKYKYWLFRYVYIIYSHVRVCFYACMHTECEINKCIYEYKCVYICIHIDAEQSVSFCIYIHPHTHIYIYYTYLHVLYVYEYYCHILLNTYCIWNSNHYVLVCTAFYVCIYVYFRTLYCLIYIYSIYFETCTFTYVVQAIYATCYVLYSMKTSPSYLSRM